MPQTAVRAGVQFPTYCRFILANNHHGWTAAEMERRFVADQHRNGAVAPAHRTMELWNYEGVVFGPGDNVVTAFEVVRRITDGVWAQDLIGDPHKIMQEAMYSLLLSGVRELQALLAAPATQSQIAREPALGLRFATKIADLNKQVKSYTGVVPVKRPDDAAAVIAGLLEKFPELVEPVHLLTGTMLKVE